VVSVGDDRSALPDFLRAELQRVVGSVSGLDIRSYETMPPEALLVELKPMVMDGLEEAISVTRKVVAEFDDRGDEVGVETEDGESDGFQRGFDFELDKLVAGTSTSQTTGERQIADVAFMASVELRERRVRVERLGSRLDGMQMLSDCDGALRRILKSLAAVERVICDAYELDATLGFETELDVSLQTRRTLTRFSRQIIAAQPPTAETLVARMRGAGIQIAKLIGRDIYPDLRIRDRLQIREFQDKILSWLRGESGYDVRTGQRMWQDLVGFLNILATVSRRQELVEHDSRVVAKAWAELFAGSTPPCVSDTLSSELQTLFGLDPEVDALLASSDASRPVAWRAPLERLRLHFRLVSPAENGLGLASDDDFF